MWLMLAGATVVAMFTVNQRLVRPLGAGLILVWFSFVQTWWTPDRPRFAMFGSCFAILVICVLRANVQYKPSRTAAALMLFQAWTIIADYYTGTDKHNVVTNVFILAVTYGFALFVMGLDFDEEHWFMRVVSALTFFQFLYGLAEQEKIVSGFWVLAGGTPQDTIDLRKNELIPSMVGRSMTSFAQPIPYGFFMGMLFLLLVRASVRISRWYAIPAVAALACIPLSGTRGAAVALVAAVAVTLALHSTLSGWLKLLSGLVAIGCLLQASRLEQMLGLSDVHDSLSYRQRAAVNSSWGNVFFRDDGVAFWAGSGRDSIDWLFQSGLIRSGGINTIDNTYMTLLAVYGVIGLGLFVFFAVRVFLTRNTYAQASLAYALVMMALWDGPLWGCVILQLTMVAALADLDRSRVARHAAPRRTVSIFASDTAVTSQPVVTKQPRPFSPARLERHP